MPEFRAANLVRDTDLLQQARQEAFALVQRDPSLAAPIHRALRDTVARRWQAKLELGSVS
jgi:ATP-dependent DNA helicase RecG